jgi:peroxiredoxin
LGSLLLRSFAIQFAIFFIAFQMLSFFRETSMLDTDVALQSIGKENTAHHLETITGDSISLKSEGKTTVLYFFAPWCQVCHASIGNLQTLFQNNEQVDVIAVALDYTSSNEVMKFTQKHQLTFPIALGNTQTKQDFAVSGYPSYYVLDKNNVITAKSMGYSSELGLYLRSL